MTIINYNLTGNVKHFSEIDAVFLNLSHSDWIDSYCGGQGVSSIESGILDTAAIYYEKERMINMNGEDVEGLKEIIADEISRRELDITLKLVE